MTTNLQFEVNGTKIKIFPAFGVISAIYAAIIFFEIKEYQAQSEGVMNPKLRLTLDQRMFKGYRNFIIHLANVGLGIQTFLALRKYEEYRVIKDKYDKLKSGKS